MQNSHLCRLKSWHFHKKNFLTGITILLIIMCFVVFLGGCSQRSDDIYGGYFYKGFEYESEENTLDYTVGNVKIEEQTNCLEQKQSFAEEFRNYIGSSVELTGDSIISAKAKLLYTLEENSNIKITDGLPEQYKSCYVKLVSLNEGDKIIGFKLVFAVSKSFEEVAEDGKQSFISVKLHYELLF